MADTKMHPPEYANESFWADGGGLVISQTKGEISVQLRQRAGWASFSLTPENATILHDRLGLMLGKVG